MSTSSPTVSPKEQELKVACSNLLGVELVGLERIGGGRNSQVYRLVDRGDRPYAVKVYFYHQSDPRDRLGTEFSGLTFLWKHGVDRIPKPLALSREMGCAIYEFVEGDRAINLEIGESQVDKAVEFLVRLKTLKEWDLQHRQESLALPNASEACFSMAAIAQNIQQRVQRFEAIDNTEPHYHRLRHFLDTRWIPAFQKIREDGWEQLRQIGTSPDRELSLQARTLSPSDFGFHNAIQRRDGSLMFVDFEYFGWDDPAKAIADFLLHPGMSLSKELKQRFWQGMLNGFQDCEDLPKRAKRVYPFFGLKWCLILLNEFLPRDLLRRQFANTGDRDRSTIQGEQLEKAESMLERVLKEYERFPYAH